jgi:hypothetical protein
MRARELSSSALSVSPLRQHYGKLHPCLDLVHCAQVAVYWAFKPLRGGILLASVMRTLFAGGVP